MSYSDDKNNKIFISCRFNYQINQAENKMKQMRDMEKKGLDK